MVRCFCGWQDIDGTLDCVSIAITCAFNRRGTLLAVGCNDGRIAIWDFLTRGIASIVNAHVHPVCSLRYAQLLTFGDLIPFRGRSPWLRFSRLLYPVRALYRASVLSCSSAFWSSTSVWAFVEVLFPPTFIIVTSFATFLYAFSTS